MSDDRNREIQDLKKRITSLEEELRQSRAKETRNENRIKDLEKEIQDLKEKIKKLENENESLFIIVQIGKTTQRNMCEYVLGKHFKKWLYYQFEKINHYITKYVPKASQESAIKRLKKVNAMIDWDQDLMDSLNGKFGPTRNKKAHPELSAEKIQRATQYLKEIGELDEEEVDNINKLTAQWERSEALLKPRVSSAEGRDQGGQTRSLPPTGQGQGTRTRNAVRGLQDISTKA